MAVLGTWAWMGLFTGFAVGWCDAQTLRPSLHRLLTRSSIVVYIFGRLVEKICLHVAVSGLGLNQRAPLLLLCSPLVLAGCMAIYVPLDHFHCTRLAFGLQ